MIRWIFPEDRRFNVIDKDGAWCGCELVAEDEETITIMCKDARSGALMSVQCLRDDIRAVTYPTSPIDTLERSLKAHG